MTVGVADVEFAGVPGLVGGRHCDFDLVGEAVLVDGVYVFDPDGHPAAFVVVVGGEGFGVRALAAAALAVVAEEDFHLPARDSTETGRVALFPKPSPAEPFEPDDAIGKIGNVQNRRHAVSDHKAGASVNSGDNSAWRGKLFICFSYRAKKCRKDIADRAGVSSDHLSRRGSRETRTVSLRFKIILPSGAISG